MIGIYKITSPSLKVYIGQSINLKRRHRQYERLDFGTQRRLKHSMLKYGFENHKIEVLEYCTEEELNPLEIYYATLYNAHSENWGLNVRGCGGKSGSLSEETKRRISIANIGKTHTKETREKLSNALKGKPAYNKGWVGRQVAWNKGITPNDNTKEKLRNFNKGRVGKDSFRAKKINQYDLEWNFIKQYYGAVDVEKETGFKRACINRACRGERVTAYNFKWKYE